MLLPSKEENFCAFMKVIFTLLRKIMPIYAEKYLCSLQKEKCALCSNKVNISSERQL